MRKQQNRHDKSATKKLAVCAMLSALGVVLLFAGSFIEVLDISMAVIASLLCVVAVIEYGGASPWLIFFVTAILSFILRPMGTPTLFYAAFFGFYPIIKEKLEKCNKVISWILKEIVFNVCLTVMILLAVFFFMSGDNLLLKNRFIIAAIVLLAELLFVLYDVALTRVISFYIIQLRSKFKFK